MKIALARGPSYQSWYKIPSIGLCYLLAALEKDGIESNIFDARYFDMNERTLIDEICRWSPDIIGFSAMTHEIKRAASIIERLKNKLHVPVIIGGCHITALPDITMKEFPVIDYGVIGEGEYTLLELIRCISTGGEGIEEIDGIVYRVNGRITRNKPRPPIANLDDVPFPEFHYYFRRGKNSLKGRHRCYHIFTSRGCPFNCVFCMRVFGKTVRRRSPENILEEIDLAIREYGAHTINFLDEIFLFNDEITKGLLNKFIENGIPERIRWSGLTKADLVNEELVALAKMAGCYKLEIGVESGNDEILKRMSKNISVAQVERAVRIMKKIGIKVSAYYIIGNPGESEKTVWETIDLSTRLNTETSAFGLMVPYPGTKVHEWARQNQFGYRLKSLDWDEYDKYGGAALEIAGLPTDKLESLQRKAYVYFYLKNLRLIGLMKFLLSRYRGILSILKRQLSRKEVAA